MNAAIALPRKDARLAGVILGPWVSILGVVFVVCAGGHVIPGMTEILWGHHSEVPPLSQRIYPAAVLASLACYLVPCWVAVVVALGDRTRQAGLLAAAVPVADSRKIVSKLCIIGGVALGVWLSWFALAIVADGSVNGQMNLFAAGAVAMGACSGLGATALVQRSVTAIVLATVLPLLGWPIAWVVTEIVQHAAAPAGQIGSNPAWGFAISQEWRPLFDWGWALTGISVVLVLAICGVPFLAARNARRHPVRSLGAAMGVACVAMFAWSVGTALWHPSFVWRRAEAARVLALRETVHRASDDAIVNDAIGIDPWGRSPDLEFIAVISPAEAPTETIGELLIHHLRGWPSADATEVRYWLLCELRQRLQDPGSRVRGRIDSDLATGRLSPMQQLRLANFIPEPEGEAIMARLLIETKSEAVHMAALAALARGQGTASMRGEDDRLSADDWCECLRLAREDLEEALYGRPALGTRPAIPALKLTPDQRTTVERALSHVNRPHPAVAALLGQNPKWAGSAALECIRTGQEHTP